MTDKSETAQAEIVAAEILNEVAPQTATSDYERLRSIVALAYLRGKSDGLSVAGDALGALQVPLRDTL